MPRYASTLNALNLRRKKMMTQVQRKTLRMRATTVKVSNGVWLYTVGDYTVKVRAPGTGTTYVLGRHQLTAVPPVTSEDVRRWIVGNAAPQRRYSRKRP